MPKLYLLLLYNLRNNDPEEVMANCSSYLTEKNSLFFRNLNW